MALTITTLNAPVTASQLLFGVTSTAAGFPGVGVMGTRQLMKIDGEFMMVDVVPATGQVKVLQRGYNGTTATFHDTLSQVATSAVNTDFLDVPVGFWDTDPPDTDDVYTIGVDTSFVAAGSAAVSGSIPMPIKNTTYLITKGSACAISIITASPQAVGVRMTFMGATAFAHTLTYLPGVNGDTTSSDVGTFAAKVGSTCTLVVGAGGLLALVGANGVVFA